MTLDPVRGFRCLGLGITPNIYKLAAFRSGCGEGEIFFEEGARLNSLNFGRFCFILLLASPLLPVGSGLPRPAALGACRRCGFMATPSQAQQLAAQEMRVEELPAREVRLKRVGPGEEI